MRRYGSADAPRKTSAAVCAGKRELNDGPSSVGVSPGHGESGPFGLPELSVEDSIAPIGLSPPVATGVSEAAHAPRANTAVTSTADTLIVV